MTDAEVLAGLRWLYGDVADFSRGLFGNKTLRPYQVEPARAIIEAVQRTQTGRSGDGPNQFAVVFSRQSGKDEMVAQLIAFLLNRYQARGGQVVLAAPTDRQATISRDRLGERLQNWLNAGKVYSKEGYVVGLGRANARFVSAAPSANVRGETASLLLVANETQDILPARWDAVFDPMAASTNATTLFLGTVWTANTLLARQMRHLRQLEAEDGQRRVFLVDWQAVAACVPAYGERVTARIAQFGERHPFIQTEYFLKELDGDGGLFGAQRRALMVGSHSRRESAQVGKLYALLIDVAGEAGNGWEGPAVRSANPRKDSTVVTVVEVDQARIGGEKPEMGMQGQPTGEEFSPAVGPVFRVVQRYVWTGTRHTDLLTRLVGLARETWRARYVVCDATGIGATLASFLDKALPHKVLPFVFSSASKSDLGWNFCGIIDSGRYKEYAADGAADTEWFWRQVAAVEYAVRPGAGQLLQWSVPDPKLHDDLVMSAALVAVLDRQDWQPRSAVGLSDRPGW